MLLCARVQELSAGVEDVKLTAGVDLEAVRDVVRRAEPLSQQGEPLGHGGQLAHAGGARRAHTTAHTAHATAHSAHATAHAGVAAREDVRAVDAVVAGGHGELHEGGLVQRHAVEHAHQGGALGAAQSGVVQRLAAVALLENKPAHILTIHCAGDAASSGLPDITCISIAYIH